MANVEINANNYDSQICLCLKCHSSSVRYIVNVANLESLFIVAYRIRQQYASKNKSPPTEDQIAIKRANAAATEKKSCANENPDQTAARRASNAENMQIFRDSQTPEQAASRRASNALTKRRARALETPEQAESRRASNVANMRRVRDSESLE
ncbi:uncharacterized protein C05D11.13-like [Octopus bimaculoides]|uniref:uncharacterized protein C05D11.13-like n=1 Tax=Octopus bimaculoides TaxID=37653 RepID=UPI0022E552DF|nr:uncharacterized protein C05D11.13-like [Octopus bimaculoides]